ncbi:MAG: GTP 3',8-cyclase MoaA [bacterium]|nr:GTP 3',8-cyclase MoaA [bacterium]
MLTDTYNRPLRDLRISVTDRCNFRCTYCMPAEVYGEHYRFLPRTEILTFEEIARLTGIFVRLGAVKVRLTGGEPLVRQELETLVAMLDAIDGVDDMALTTNGYYLPQKAQALHDAGLRRVTISLDSLDNAVFRRMNGKKASVEQVLAGIDAAEKAGLAPIKINCVVQRGVNDHTIVDLARYSRERGWIVRFIEYMDVGNVNGWEMQDVVSADEIVARIDAALPLEQIEANYHGEVARRYRYRDGGGEIGLITSVTQPFCGACNRMRLSADGKIYTCLFAANGTDLRGPMRDGASDDDLEQIVRATWGKRIDRYSQQRFKLREEGTPKVEMYAIGG